MEALQKRIETIRFSFSNTENRKFIPETALYGVITEPDVKETLKDLKVPIHEINDITNDILRGARKCFAILLVIGQGKSVSNFIKHDSLQQTTPDSRLPYNVEQLRQIFEEEPHQELAVEKFLERQWEFSVPILQRHTVFRELHTSAILPFRCTHHVGQGAMGDAWKVELYPECHQLPLDDHTVIRKEFKYNGRDGKSAFEKELENLALLTNLKHKNIVEMYCAYKYRDRYNLVFAFARGGSLEDMLTGKIMVRPSDSQLLLALAELASAIDAFHNFTSEALDLKLSGCHHDLAPRNIFIHDETFILADFGLSSLRSAKEDSLTLFKDVRGSFLAPECQPLQGGQLITGQISRTSDIWSFGCILSEILAYMKAGSDGVQQFREKREIEVTPDLIWPRFHRGPGKPNPFIESWLSELQTSGKSHFVRMVDLIRKMLSMDPKERPRSAGVLTALRGIWITCFGESIQILLNDICQTHSSIDCILNRMRFKAWLLTIHQLLDISNYNSIDSPVLDFPKIVHSLKEVDRVLNSSSDMTSSDRHQQQSLLRYQNVQLTESLPKPYRHIAKEHFESILLQSNDTEHLGDLSMAVKAEGDEDIGILIAVKRLTVLSKRGRLIERDELNIDQHDIAIQEGLGIHDTALLVSTSELVVVEWLNYKGLWADVNTGGQLLKRLMSVTGLLHAESTAKIPGTLHCRGIFHDSQRRAFGVVYDLPSPPIKPITLYGLLSASKSPYRPLLEYRFRLASDICRCIHTFHKIGWLHRNLHSMNVLFFPAQELDKSQWAKDPRIVGFAASREIGFSFFTSGPEDNGQLRSYQHPEYLTHQERYREMFDYYSLGLLLLEIGLWSPLAEMTNSPRFQGLSDEGFRRAVIDHRVSRLGIYMGTRYMEATRACLDDSLARGGIHLEGQEGAILAAFKSRVLDQILVMK